jgi:hypothetical protein
VRSDAPCSRAYGFFTISLMSDTSAPVIVIAIVSGPNAASLRCRPASGLPPSSMTTLRHVAPNALSLAVGDSRIYAPAGMRLITKTPFASA